jgi:hypothetical protein
MSVSESEILEKVQAVIGTEETVQAAGAFELADDYKKIAAGGLATGLLLPSNPATDGVAAAGVLEAERYENAASQGVSQRMMVAVTDKSIYVYELPNMRGNDPGKQLFHFDRETAHVEVKKFGLARHVNISQGDGQDQLKLTGSSVVVNPDHNGDRAVLAELVS